MLDSFAANANFSAFVVTPSPVPLFLIHVGRYSDRLYQQLGPHIHTLAVSFISTT